MFKTLFTYLPFAFALLAFLLFVLPCRVRTRAQAVWAMILLLCAAKFMCFDAFGGDAFAPELPEKFIWVWNWAYSGLCLLVPLAAPGLLLPRRIRLVLVPVLAWGFAAKGVFNGVKVPEVREVVFANGCVPEALDGYRIVQLSDLHVSSAARRRRTEAIVAKVNGLDADLVVVTGDIVDGSVAKRRRDVEPLKDLRARDGVLFCDGNHEHYFNWREWRAQYAKWNLKFLENEGVSPRPGLHVAGVTDPASARDGSSCPDLRRAFAAGTNGAFRLLLKHRPNYFDPSEEVDLQLSGHTHGGIAPGLDWLVARHNDGFVKGFRPRSGECGCFGTVYVSPGTGQWAGFPIRFFNDPEITVITLRRPEKQELALLR